MSSISILSAARAGTMTCREGGEANPGLAEPHQRRARWSGLTRGEEGLEERKEISGIHDARGVEVGGGIQREERDEEVEEVARVNSGVVVEVRRAIDDVEHERVCRFDEVEREGVE